MSAHRSFFGETATSTFTSSGTLGIGTVNPGYSLDVLGDINFTGALREDGNEIFASMIAPFAGSCPTGWTEYTAARGRTVVGTPSGGTNAGTVGSALSDLGARTITDVPSHVHTVDPPSTDTSTDGAHTHSTPSSDGSANSSGTTANVASNTNGTTGSAGSHSHTLDIAAFNSESTGVASVDVTMPYIQLTYCQKTAGSDLAEWMPASEDMRAATIVSIDPQNRERVIASRRAYDNSVVGIVATKPGWLLGQETPDSVQMALAGRVPLRLSLKNGEIRPGDPVTTSSIPGVGMKATQEGPIVGKAMEAVNETSSLVTCLDPATGQDEKCTEALVFVNISWYSPNDLADEFTSDIASNHYPESLSVGAEFKEGDIVSLTYEYVPQQHNTTIVEKVGHLLPANSESFAVGVITKRINGPGELLRRTRKNNIITDEVRLITSGKADVMISPRSQAIKPGDPIAVSVFDDGMGERARKPGFTIGRALEAWEPGKERNLISMLVDSSWYVPPMLEAAHIGHQDDHYTQSSEVNNASESTDRSGYVEYLFQRLAHWLADAANGIERIVARIFKGERAEFEELCLGETCVNEDQLKALLGAAAIPAPAPGGNTTPESGEQPAENPWPPETENPAHSEHATTTEQTPSESGTPAESALSGGTPPSLPAANNSNSIPEVIEENDPPPSQATTEEVTPEPTSATDER